MAAALAAPPPFTRRPTGLFTQMCCLHKHERSAGPLLGSLDAPDISRARRRAAHWKMSLGPLARIQQSVRLRPIDAHKFAPS